MKKTNSETAGWFRWFKRISFAILILAFVVVAAGHYYVTKQVRWLPGKSFSGVPTQELQQLEDVLESHVQVLAGQIGERSIYIPGECVLQRGTS